LPRLSRRASDRDLQRHHADRRRQIALLIGVALLALAGAIFYWWPRTPPSDVHDGAPSWSPDSRRLLFTVEQNGQTDIFVMNADGTDRRQLTHTDANEASPVFSPDGSQIAFDTDRDGNSEIYVMDAAGTHPRRLTDHPAQDRAPSWSPDGRQIAFMSDREARPDSQIFVMNADGTGVKRVTGRGSAWTPQFSPDGREIAAQIDRDVYVVDLASGTERRLTYDPNNGMSPAWSPDGRQLVFLSTRNQRLELFTMQADGTDQALLVSLSAASAIDPRWSPDGTRVAFVSVPTISGTAPHGQPYAIEVIDLASRKITRVSP
jgi:Tol biopolymer transport system component